MKRLSLILLMAGSLSASTVNVTFIGTSGIADSAGDQVLPYYLSIDGGPALAADCYDFFDQITTGQTWTANIDTLAEAVATGRFSGDPGALAGYELIGVLSTLTALTPQNDIDLQQAIWNVFDAGRFSVSPGMAAFLALATSDVPVFDFSQVRFIEPVTPGSAQPFVVLESAPPAPEPGTLLLIGAGLVVIGGRKWRSRQR